MEALKPTKAEKVKRGEAYLRDVLEGLLDDSMDFDRLKELATDVCTAPTDENWEVVNAPALQALRKFLSLDEEEGAA